MSGKRIPYQIYYSSELSQLLFVWQNGPGGRAEKEIHHQMGIPTKYCSAWTITSFGNNHLHQQFENEISQI